MILLLIFIIILSVCSLNMILFRFNKNGPFQLPNTDAICKQDLYRLVKYILGTVTPRGFPTEVE